MNQIKINNTLPVQEDFWGNGAVYHAYAGMPDHEGRVYNEEQCIIEAKRATDMKLKIARTFYGWWAWEPATNTWNWENERMKPFYRWLQRMKDGGVVVALNTGWCSPGDINSTSWNGKSPFTVEGDWEASLKNYGDWVSETVNQLIIKRGFDNIKFFVMFTEPTRHSGVHEKDPFDCWYDAVKAAHTALVRDGRRDYVKFMGANEGTGVTSHMLKWAADNADDMIDIYSSHTYQHEANIPNSYKKSGKFAATFAMAGGRICRTVAIKPNTDYVLKAEVFFTKVHNENAVDGIHFGAFIDDGRNDIHVAVGCGPNTPIAETSVITINPDTLSPNYSIIEVNFNSGNANSTVIGLFHDVKNAGMTCVDYFELCEAGSSVNVIENGDFSNEYDGWLVKYGGGVKDAYFDWYRWAKTGLQYVPAGKPYCFDEYNVVFDRDNSRDSHGAEIVTIAVALMNAGVQSSLLWTLFDQQWPNNHATNSDSFYDGDHRCGVAPLLTRSLVPHKSYYAFSLISKYVDGMGTKVYEGFGNDCLHTTMSVSKDGEVTIVVVNSKDISEDFTITFEETLNSLNLNRHTFAPESCMPDEKAEIIGIDKVFNCVTNSLSDSIAPYGVTVYTTHLD